MVEKKACPQCGTSMSYRLGVYECPQCGHAEEKARPPAQAVERSGPGFRKEAWHRPQTGSQPGQVPPPPMPGTVYTPGAAPPPGLYQESSGDYNSYPSLQTEKMVFFGLQALGWLFTFFLILAAPAYFGVPPNAGVDFGAMAFGAFLGGVIALGLYWFVLFSEQVWAKYCCGGCIVISLLLTVPGMFLSGAPPGYDLPGVGVYSIFSGILSIGINLWLLWILWRDAQRLQGR